MRKSKIKPYTGEGGYNFYRLDEATRIDIVLNRPIIRDGYCIQVAIGLTEEGSWFNYNVAQGLVSISNVRDGWFRIGAFSPDDLDYSLVFNNGATEELRENVIRYMEELVPITNVTYRELFLFLQDKFGGEIGD